MSPMTISDTIALGALAIAAISLLWGIWRSGKAQSAVQQTILDQMRGITTGLAEVKKALSDLRADISTHGQQLAAMQAKVDSLEQRVSRVEARCDAHTSMGGTD